MLHDVLEEHLDEISFLHERWLALRADPGAIAEERSVRERLEAHVEGLRLGGEPAWELCVARLDDAGPGEVFAAAKVATQNPERLTRLRELGGDLLR